MTIEISVVSVRMLRWVPTGDDPLGSLDEELPLASYQLVRVALGAR